MYKKFIPLIIAAILLSYIGINNALSPRSISVGTAVIKQAELPQNPVLENTDKSNQKIICIGGDVNLAEAMADHIAKDLKPFAGLTEITKDCDLFIVNLETNVADANVGQRQPKNYAFKAPPATLQVLVDAGVDVVDSDSRVICCLAFKAARVISPADILSNSFTRFIACVVEIS